MKAASVKIFNIFVFKTRNEFKALFYSSTLGRPLHPFPPRVHLSSRLPSSLLINGGTVSVRVIESARLMLPPPSPLCVVEKSGTDSIFVIFLLIFFCYFQKKIWIYICAQWWILSPSLWYRHSPLHSPLSSIVYLPISSSLSVRQYCSSLEHAWWATTRIILLRYYYEFGRL